MKRKLLHLCLAGAGLFLAFTGGAQPVITIPPTNQVVFANNTNTVFTVGVSGAGQFSYQWLFNGTNLPNGGIITTAIGKYKTSPPFYSGDNGPATNAVMRSPVAMAVDSLGNIFIADTDNNVVRKVDTNGIISRVAGTNNAVGGSSAVGGYSGDGGAATNAQLSGPSGVAVDKLGNIFIADGGNARIRKIDTNGIITTFAGNGTNGFYGDGGQATNAEIKVSGGSTPSGLCLDSLGNLYLADTLNNRIRKIDTNGIITTIASIPILEPLSVVADSWGNIFVADAGVIHEIKTNGIITVVAGGGSSLADGGLATNAQISPYGLCVDTNGNLFIGDITTNRRGVRKVDTNGIITTVAGNGLLGYTGDGGMANNAEMGCAYGLGFDPSGNLLVLDQLFNVVRKVSFAGQPALSLGKLSPSSSGNYQVVVSSSSGSVTSSVANLSVFYPPISSGVNINSNSFVIAWPVFQPSVFQVQWTTNLAGGTWSNLGSTVSYTKTTSGIIGQSDYSWTNYLQGYYRVVWIQ